MWIQDLKFALRQLRSSMGFASLTVITLAIGVGANTALFTVVESVLLRPLPYAQSRRMVFIGPTGSSVTTAETSGFQQTSWLNYRDIHDQAKYLAQVGAYDIDIGVVQGREGAQTVVAPHLTPSIFPILGVQPILGRSFTQAEGQAGGPQAVLLSEALWRQSFNADRAIIGKTIKVGGVEHTVVGVMPGNFRFPEEAGPDMQRGVWLPLQPTAEMLSARGYNFFVVLGQMRLGVSQAQVQAELDAISSRIRQANPTRSAELAFRVTPYREVLTGPVRPVFYALLAALALVLLIACANVANLLLARCLGRGQEFAVRAALGASRLRLVRQMLTEGALLSILGCGFGFVLAELALTAVHKLPPGTMPRADSIAMHWTVILVLAAIATLTTLLSSLFPGFLVARTNPQPALQAASRGVGSRSVSGKLSHGLVIGEVALSTLLLIGTGLLFHTLWNLEHSKLGFVATRVTTFNAFSSDSAGFSDMGVSQDRSNAPLSLATSTYAPLLDRARQAPGVQSAALSTAPPLSGTDMHSSFNIVGRPVDHAHTPEARITAVSGDYARTMGTPILRGRMVDEDDGPNAPYVAVVNQALVKRYFAGRDPLQQRIDLGGKDTGMVTPYTIVGVLADQVDDRVGGSVQPFVLLPYQQVPTTSLFYQALIKTQMSFMVKTRGDVPVAAEMRSIFHKNAPDLAVDNFQTMQEAIDQNTFSQRLGLYLVGAFAGLAVAMVIAGLYGVLAQLVSYRRREIGIRMAVGATRQSIAGMILRQGSILMGIGLAAGMLLALFTGNLLTRFLYQVRPTDWGTYLAAGVILLGIGSAASLIPARRAASIEPMQALHED